MHVNVPEIAALEENVKIRLNQMYKLLDKKEHSKLDHLLSYYARLQIAKKLANGIKSI